MIEESPQTWLDIWALCRREHGLSWAEFQDMTLAELEALEERRTIEVRHARFNAGLIVSALCHGEMSPFDFIAGIEKDPEEEERRRMRKETKRDIANIFLRIADQSPEVVQAKKRDVIERLTANGVEDPEGLIREVFPEL